VDTQLGMTGLNISGGGGVGNRRKMSLTKHGKKGWELGLAREKFQRRCWLTRWSTLQVDNMTPRKRGKTQTERDKDTKKKEKKRRKEMGGRGGDWVGVNPKWLLNPRDAGCI